MRILLVTDSYPPSTRSVAMHMYDLACHLQRIGHESIVLTPCAEQSVLVSDRIEDKIRVIRVRSGAIKGVPYLKRALNEMMLSPLLWRRAKSLLSESRCNGIIVYSPSIFFGPLLRKLHSTWNCPVYLVLRDIFPQWAVDTGVLKRGVAWRLLRKVEEYLYNSVDTIGVQTPANLDYFPERFAKQSYRTEVLYNWIDLNPLPPNSTSLRAKLGLSGKTVFLFGGVMGIAQELENIIELARQMRHRQEAHFLFVGDGEAVPALKKKVEELQLGNVTFHPSLPLEIYKSVVAEFDVGIISLRRDFATQNFPGKTLSYMAARIPILASLNPGNDLADILHGAQCGLASVAGCHEQLYQFALRLLGDASLRTQMGENGYSLLCQDFSVEVAAKQILERFVDKGLYSRDSAHDMPVRAILNRNVAKCCCG